MHFPFPQARIRTDAGYRTLSPAISTAFATDRPNKLLIVGGAQTSEPGITV